MSRIVAIIVIVCSVHLLAQSFSLETVTEQKREITIIDSSSVITLSEIDWRKLERNFNKIERAMRAQQAFEDSNFVQFDTASTGAGYTKTVYLDTKYSSSWYALAVDPITDTTKYSSVILSDSSFTVTTGVANTKFRWMAIGVRKPERN